MAASWYRPHPYYGWQAPAQPAQPAAQPSWKPAWTVNFAPGFGTGAQVPFAPYQTPTPPPGSYDPNLDAALGQSQRGFADLQQDVGTQRLRAASDYGIGVDQVNLQRGYDQGDLDTSLARGNQDIGLQTSRNTEDYSQQIATLQRAYTQLQGQQAEGDRHAGVTSAGIAMLQAAKRAQNQAIDRQPIDTDYSRAQSDLGTRQARMYEDASSQSGRIQTGANNQIAGLGLGYARTTSDLGTQLDRGERENAQFGIDTAAQKSAQASQMNWSIPAPGTPGGKPLNEHTNASGQTFKTVKQGGWVYQVDPSGRVLNKRRAKS